MSSKTILVVDDEPEIVELVETYLLRERFKVLKANNGKKALQSAQENHPDLIILDIMLPELDGMEVCRILRTNNQTPVIFLSAKSDEFDKVLGLGVGGDDYLTKPFSPRELVARVKANLRRITNDVTNQSELSPSHQSDYLVFSDMKIDLEGYRVWIKDQELKLSVKEFELLKFLATHPNKVFSKEKLYDCIWGADSFGDSRTVMVHISRLREKLERYTSTSYLKTVWGIGYKFELNNDA